MTINEMNKGRSGKYPKVLLAALIMTAMIFASVSLLFGPDNGNAGESTLGAPDLTVDIGRVEDAAQLGRIIGSAFADAVKGSEDDVEITVMVTGTNSFSDKLTIINPMLLEWLESDVYFTILWDADYTAAVAEDFAMELFGPGTLIITDGGSIELTSGYGEEYGPALNLSEVSLQVDDGTLNVNGDICSGNDANIYVSGGLRASGTLYISDSDSGIASIGYGAVAEVGGVSIEGWNASVAADEGGSIVILDSVTSVGLMTVITAHDGGSVEVGGDVTFSNVLSRINALNSGVVAIDGNVTMYGDIGISDDPSGLYADTYGLIEVGGDVLTEFGYTGIWADNGGTLIINGSVTAEDSYIRSWGGIMTICGVSGSVFIEAYDGEYITEGGTIAIEKDVTITGVSTWYTAGKYVIRVRGSGDLMIGGQAVVSADHVIISAGDSPRGLASPLSSGEGPLAHGIAIAGSLSMNNTARLETYGMSILIGGDVGMTGSYSSIFAYIGVIDIAGQVNMAGER
ncbi:MAG: hypothetical protein FWG58_04620, partial [Methanomassiliicoccaceae archaeon]|nr:hypothetical protein [Methanomassiliicoccaceae archaeon]